MNARTVVAQGAAPGARKKPIVPNMSGPTAPSGSRVDPPVDMVIEQSVAMETLSAAVRSASGEMTPTDSEA